MVKINQQTGSEESVFLWSDVVLPTCCKAGYFLDNLMISS